MTCQIQLAVLCCYHNQKLLRCDIPSLLNSVMEASELGLSLSRSSGEAYLIPRWNKDLGVMQAHFMAGYQGLVKLSLEAGVRYVHGRVVCRQDDFEWGWASGRESELEYYHKLRRDGTRGDITHVYAVAKLERGDLIGECMTVEEVQSIRLRSQTPNEGPWVTDWEPMAKKTAVRQLDKWLPKTQRLIRAIESHDADFDFARPIEVEATQVETVVMPNQVIDAPAEPQIAASSPAPAAVQPPTKANRLTAQLAARAAALQGVKVPASVLAPRPAAPPARPSAPPASPPVAEQTPKTGQQLADYAKHHNITFFATYGRSRKFPVPMTAWSADQVNRAWEGYVYERDVLRSFEPVNGRR